MKEEAKRVQTQNRNLPYYILAFLIFILPLIFTKHVEGIFTTTKSAVFRILSCVFFISIFIYLWDKIKQNKIEITINKAIDAAVLFIYFSAVISTIFSLNPYVSIFGQYTRQIGLITYTIITLLYFLSSFILLDKKNINNLLFIMTLSGAFVGIYSLLQYFGFDPFGIQPAAYTRPVSSMGSSVFAAGLMVMVLPFAIIQVLNFKSLTLYIIFALILFFILAGIVISQTRTVYAAALVELILFCLVYPYALKPEINKFKKARKAGLIILCSLIILIIIIILIFPESIFIKRFKGIVNIQKTERWGLWLATLNMFRHYPIVGTGLSAYSIGFEDFLTTALKHKDPFVFYDHPHSNYLNALATMGVIGFAAYLYLLFTAVRYSVGAIFKYQESRIVFTAFLCMFSGYIVYGMADFDEITHLVYLYILLAVFKSVLFLAGKRTSIKLNTGKPRLKTMFAFTAAVIAIFSLFNIYAAYIDFKADNIYSDGINTYNSGYKNINELNAEFTKVIELNPRPEYRYACAQYNYLYCTVNPVLDSGKCKTLLKIADDQLAIALKDYPAKYICQKLLSLVKYYEGDTAKAEELKKEVFVKDSVSSHFRMELARYYFKNNKEEPALEQLYTVNKYDPKNTDAYFTLTVYMIYRKEYSNAEEYCNKILKFQPGNQRAIYFLNEIRKLKGPNQ